MEKWHYISLLLCAFGFFKEFRPSEPFVTEYLIDFKNFTKDTIVQVAYPISTYTYFGTLPVVFLITDLLRYKSIIILEGVAFVVTYILLLWGNGINSLRILEVLYGIASSTEVAYYTYIYAKVDKSNYKKVTSHTYTAILVGNFVAALVAQILVSTDLMNYKDLTYLTLGSVAVSLVIACFLPNVKQSVYFYRSGQDQEENVENGSGGDKKIIPRVKRAYGFLWRDFKNAYKNSYVLKWSVWWAISSACYIQVTSYVQPLWEEIYPSSEGEIYNAAVDAIHTLLSASLALAVGYVNLPWNKYGEPFLCVMSLIQGAILIVMSQTSEIMVAYACYIIFRTGHQVMITVASAEVAQGISQDSYGLIFGINRFLALTLQTILTFAVADENGFALGERDQFLVYGSYFSCLGVLFGVVTFMTITNCWKIDKDKKQEKPENESGNDNHTFISEPSET